MSARVPANEVFTSPALILDDIREAMDALCLEVGEEPLSMYPLEGELHPALLLLWQVQAYLVDNLKPDSWREYRGLLPGLRVNGRPLQAFTMNRGPSPLVRRVVVVERWTPEPPRILPQTRHQERRPPQPRPQKR